MDITTLAAYLFVLLTLGTALFQCALVFGAPWGELTLGGRTPGVLPTRLRAVALLSLLLLLAFAAIVAARAALVLPGLQSDSRWLIWGVVGYCGLGVVANAMTPSRRERRLWLPVVICMLVSSGIVAVS